MIWVFAAGTVLAWAALVTHAWRRYRHGRWKYPVHHDLLALGLFAALDAGFFWEVLFRGAYVPRGGGDLASFIYPRFVFAARSLRAGMFPLWNPYSFGGQPYFADVQSGLLYAPNLLAFLGSGRFSYRTLERLVIAHYWLAAVAMYLLARRLGCGPAAALVGGIVWGWSGFLVAHLGHYNMVAATAWLPLVLALVDIALVRRRLVWTVGAGAVLSLSVFAGHTQMTLYSILAAGLYAAVWAFWRECGGLRWRAGWAVIVTSATVLLALAFSAVQLIPSYELVRHSIRAEIDYTEASAFALPPQKLITFLVPHFYGASVAEFWGPSTLTESFGYVGILPLALAAAALVLRRDSATAAFAVQGGVGLLLALGAWTPLHGWLYALVPGFDKVRAPGRFLALVDLAIAGLAALGADVSLRGVPWRLRPRFRVILTGVGVTLAGVLFVVAPQFYTALLLGASPPAELADRAWLAINSFALFTLFLAGTFGWLLAARYQLLAPRWLAAGAVALLVTDLFSAGTPLNPTHDDPTVGFRQLEITGFLRRQQGAFRIEPVAGTESLWQPDMSVLEGIPSVWGLWNPLTLADYYMLVKQYVHGVYSPLYDLLGARYVVARKETPVDSTKFQPVFTDHPQLAVYENAQAIPRFLVVNGEIRAATHDEALHDITAPGFDPRREIVVEGATGPPLVSESAAGTGAADSGQQMVMLELYEPNRIQLSATLDRPGYLLLVEVYYPGWHARVDGRPMPVLCADWTFRAVRLEPGTHRVELWFLPPSLLLGAAVSAVAWVFGFAWVARTVFAGWHKGFAGMPLEAAYLRGSSHI